MTRKVRWRVSEEAGFADHVFEITSLDDGFNRFACDAVAAQMRDAGMTVERTVIPGSTYYNGWLEYPFSATEWNHRELGVQILNPSPTAPVCRGMNRGSRTRNSTNC